MNPSAVRRFRRWLDKPVEIKATTARAIYFGVIGFFLVLCAVFIAVNP